MERPGDTPVRLNLLIMIQSQSLSFKNASCTERFPTNLDTFQFFMGFHCYALLHDVSPYGLPLVQVFRRSTKSGNSQFLNNDTNEAYGYPPTAVPIMLDRSSICSMLNGDL